MTFKSFFAVLALTLSTLTWNAYSAQEIGDIDHLTGIIGSQKPVVVKFSAAWCGPCKQMAPMFEAVSNDSTFKDVKFFKVDIDRARTLASKYNVQSIPTTIFFKNGKEVGRINGAPKKQDFVNKIKSYCGV